MEYCKNSECKPPRNLGKNPPEYRPYSKFRTDIEKNSDILLTLNDLRIKDNPKIPGLTFGIYGISVSCSDQFNGIQRALDKII